MAALRSMHAPSAIFFSASVKGFSFTTLRGSGPSLFTFFALGLAAGLAAPSTTSTSSSESAALRFVPLPLPDMAI